ncbi:efflux RND transporter permease subunit [Ketobacter sp. MCCC 1A13808]|uniref:efflux RND transporter permease subunit n=1 Tax=Ketobacter sp. MCCC 1A13808 TaxID=2602738 RepID=UPI000F21E173|nr:efflux RND transporter permease subunit [Ketobacter sp. MCCC 1A13808]MVF13729.1 efflux RND transporter permease subunit [Ketobacter sp. MCCC 1A13808]RLP52358.1 MAG: efflux RND transporter permease subunit [Ketobacter sp.]
MARFFIDRPRFACVIALIILLGGVLSIGNLPVAQYPNIAPPSIKVSASYPGASAQTLEETVTAVIEQEMNGIEGLQSISSDSSASGSANITITFASGTDTNIAQVEVNNRVKRVEARLPEQVRRQGLRVDKATRNYMMIITLSSNDGSMDAIALGNYVNNHIIDEIRRVKGVGEAEVFGTQYAMRIWLDPIKLTAFSLTPGDVVSAVQTQNVQVAAGELGGLPSNVGQMLNATVVTDSRLSTVKDFENVLLKVNATGSSVRLGDVARVELGGESYASSAFANGQPAAAMGIKLSPTGNAVETNALIVERMQQLAQFFPAGMVWDSPYDTTAFVRISITEVIHTLLEAVFLVFLVMLLFLQNLRATLIPTIVVPVALMGAFIGLNLFGFSINVLTLFGLVLGIGILVDDAIVVVENVERIMREERLSPLEATRKAMRQITGAIVGITTVLVAVFIPMAFFSGSVGAIYRQFSLALITSILFSAFLALSLTPALCATLLKPHGEDHKGFFGWFNRMFDHSNNGYQKGVSYMVKRIGRFMLIYLIIVGGVTFFAFRLPTSFLPQEDQGYFITIVQLPSGATQERTIKVLRTMENYYLKNDPNVEKIVSIAGFSFFGTGQNAGIAFVRLKDWSERKRPDQHVEAVIGRAWGALSSVRDAVIFPLNPPSIPELGTATGFEFQLKEIGGQGHAALTDARNMLLGMAMQEKKLIGVRPEGMEDTSQLRVDVDREKAGALGISINEINTTLGIALGSSYINDFVNKGQVQKVIVQADAYGRMLPENIMQLRVRNNEGNMVPFSAFADAEWIMGSPRLTRYNGSPSMKIGGQAAAGVSSGEAMDVMARLASKLPTGFTYEWSGQSYEEIVSEAQAPALFMLSLLVVFLCLAALYESWSIPVGVILAVPLGVLGCLAAVYIRGMPNDVFFKIGLITIIGLAAKNAILIIEFAKDEELRGVDMMTATIDACRMRLRPILMTSLAFTFGVVPLAISSGAGAASRQAIGTGVVGGMIAATFLAILFVPVFYIAVRKWMMRSKPIPRH